MENTENHNRRTPQRWLLLAGVALIGLLAVVARAWGAFQTPAGRNPVPDERVKGSSNLPLPAESVVPEQTVEAPAAPPASANPLQAGWFRWLVIAEIGVAIVWIVLNVPPPYSVLLLAFTGGTFLIGGAHVLQTHFLQNTPQPRTIWKNITVNDRTFVVGLLTLTAVELMCVSAFFFAPDNLVDNLPLAVLFMLVGGLVLWAATGVAAPAFRLPRLVLPVNQITPVLRRFHPLHMLLLATGSSLLVLFFIGQQDLLGGNNLPQFQRLWFGLLLILLGLNQVNWWRGLLLTSGFGLLALVAEINGIWLPDGTIPPVSSAVQLALLIGGGVLLALGLDRRGDQPHTAAFTRRDWLWMGLALLLALALRFWRLDDTARFFVDELSFAGAMGRFRIDNDVPLLVPMGSVAAFPYLFNYWQWWGEALFGRNLIGMRAASAVVGALTVPAVYFLGRVIADRKVAFVGALLLATLPPHLHFSRLALNNIVDPLFGVLAFAFLAKAVRDNQRLDYVIGGIFLGLTHYFYEGGRLLYTPLALLWILTLALIWRQRIDRWNVVAAASAAFVVAFPIYYTLWGLERPMTARMIDNGQGLAREYWQNMFRFGTFDFHVRAHILPALLAYVYYGDLTLFYRGRTAILLAAVFPAALLGLFHALRRWHTPGALLLLLWVLASSGGNSLLVDSTASTRFVIAHPALVLLMALGVCYTAALLITRHSLQRVVIGLVAVGMGLWQVNYYFNVHIPVYNEQFRDNWSHADPEDAILRSRDFPPQTHIHLISLVRPELGFNAGVLNYFRDDLLLFTATPDQITADYFAEMAVGVDHAFFVERGDRVTVALLKQYFSLQPAQNSPYDLPLNNQYVLYYAPYSADYPDTLPPTTP